MGEIVEGLMLMLAARVPRGRLGARACRLFLRLAGIAIGKNTTVVAPLRAPVVGTCPTIRIGRGSFLNAEIRFGGLGGVAIGDWVQIGPRVSFETVTHPVAPVAEALRAGKAAPIRVEDHAWIGAGAIILPGVTIGRGSVVAAGAVVHRDVPPMSVVGGVPARLLRTIEG